MFLVFYKRPVKRRVKFGGTQLLSRLSHKVCRLLSFPVLLRKLTTTLRTTAMAAKTSSLKLCRVYSNPLKVLSVGEFSWSWILGSAPEFRKRKTIPVCVCLYLFPRKHRTMKFYVLAARDGKVMYRKKGLHARNCCFAYQSLCVFYLLVAIVVIVAKAPFHFRMTRTIPV